MTSSSIPPMLELPPPRDRFEYAKRLRDERRRRWGRRSTDVVGAMARAWMRGWLSLTNPFRDKPGAGLSLTKILACYFALLVGHTVERNPVHTISVNALWLSLASLSAAFGKSTFNFLLTKVSLQQTDATTTANTNTNTTTTNITKTISERRDVDRGFEPAP